MVKASASESGKSCCLLKADGIVIDGHSSGGENKMAREKKNLG